MAYAAIGIAAIIVIAGIAALVWHVIGKIRSAKGVSDSELKEAASYFLSSTPDNKLFNAIRTITNREGIQFLSRPNCLNYLADYYNFATEHETKMIIIELINSGAMNDWVYTRTHKAKLLVKAYTSLKNSLCIKYNQKLVKDIVITILSVVANLSQEDIISYSQNTRSNKPISTNKEPKFVLPYIFGLVLTYGSITLYSICFCGVRLSGIIYLTFLFQLIYMLVIDSELNTTDSTYEKNIIYILSPICIGFIFNDLIGLLFISENFRQLVFRYLNIIICFFTKSEFVISLLGKATTSDFIPNVESVLLLTADILVITVFLYLFFRRTHITTKCVKSKLLRGSTCVLMFGYLILFFIPFVINTTVDSRYSKSLETLKNSVVNQVDKNNKIRLSRNNKCPILSFKDIVLGMDFSKIDSLDTYAYRLSPEYNYINYNDFDCDDFVQKINSKLKRKDVNKYFENDFVIKQSELADAFEASTHAYFGDNSDIIGHLKRYDTELDNKNICVYIFECTDKVGAILIKPQLDDKQGFLELVKPLYIRKYGEPEHLINVDPANPYEAIYWTFSNGTIYLDCDRILYIDSLFIRRLDWQSKSFRQNQRRIQADSIQRAEIERKAEEQRLIDAEKAEKARKEENHKNAINEI
jgi:hypothetical protein